MATKARETRKAERRKVSAKRWADEQQSGSGALNVPPGTKFFKKKAGTSRLDIIPFKAGQGNPSADKGELHFERTYFVHYNVGINNTGYVCLAQTAKKKCPICEWRHKEATNPDADEKAVKALAFKKRQLFNVVDADHPDLGVQLYEDAFFNFGKLLKERVDGADEDEEHFQYFADPDDGSMLKVRFVEEPGDGRAFVKAGSIDFKPRKDAIKPAILKKALCLDEVIQLLDYAELKKIFLQTDDSKKKGGKKASDEDEDDEEDDEEEDEDEPAPKKKKKGKAKAADPDEEEDDVDEDDEDEEEDEEEDDEETDEDEEDGDEEKTVKKKRGRPAGGKNKPKPDDDDEEDEDEDDEEDEDEDEDDDPPPPKKKKGKAKPAADDDEDDEEWDDKPKKKKTAARKK